MPFAVVAAVLFGVCAALTAVSSHAHLVAVLGWCGFGLLALAGAGGVVLPWRRSG